MTLEKIIDLEYTHPYYHETVEIALQAAMIHSQDPEDQRSELERYRGSEEKELMDQRVKMHNPISAAILQPTYSYQSLIFRADGTKKVHVCPDPNKKQLIENGFARFYGEMSLHEYIDTTVRHYNNIDPNAYVGYERENVLKSDGTLDYLMIYPVEFTSEQVVSPLYSKNGLLVQLTTLDYFTAIDDKGRKTMPLKAYRQYNPGGWIVAYEANRDGATHPDATPENGFVKRTLTIKGKATTFYWKEGQNDTTEVPFFRVGGYDHPQHRNKVKSIFVHDSIGLINGLIRDDNFLAIQKAVHCSPDRSEYIKPCKHVNEQGSTCQGGYYGGVVSAENTCHSCRGIGYNASISEQKVTRLQWPDNPEDLVELSKIKHYHERPLEIAEMYIREIIRTSELIFSTTYNQNSVRPSGVQVQSSASVTATEVNRNADLINNKLTKLAAKIEDGYELAFRVAHQYYGVSGGDVELTHPSDFKVLTTPELITQHQAAVEAQLPSSVRASIIDDLLNKQYRNFPDIKEDIKAFEKWKPWSGKTSEEIVIIASSRSEEDFQRRLWENWEMVENRVKANLTPNEYEPRFYLLTYDKQQEEITKALEQVSELSSYISDPEPEPFRFEDAIVDDIDEPEPIAV